MRMLQPGDLVLCSGTLPREASLAERITAATAGGFAGISLWGRDYWAARRGGLTDADIRLMLSDHGVGVAEIDPAWWWLPGASEIHIPADVDREEVFCYGEDADVPNRGSGRGSLAQRGRRVRGRMERKRRRNGSPPYAIGRPTTGCAVHLEFLPWSRIADVSTAWEIVRTADRGNGGVAVDSWHWFRGGGDDAVLRSDTGGPHTWDPAQ